MRERGDVVRATHEEAHGLNPSDVLPTREMWKTCEGTLLHCCMLESLAVI